MIFFRVNLDGLDYMATSEEVYGRDEEADDEETGTEKSFTRSGLHRVLNKCEGAEQTKLYIITETRRWGLNNQCQ